MLSKLSPKSIIVVIASAIFGRLATAVSQAVAAFYLTPVEFGVYATGVGVLIATGLLRGGGSGNHLVTMKPMEFETDGGRFLRYALVFGALAAGLSIAAAWPVAGAFAASKTYPEAELRNVILLLGVNAFVMTATTYPRARIGANLRFNELSLIDIGSGIIKLSATWFLAARGFGALALALPLLVAAIFENAWTWTRAGVTRRELIARPGWFRETLSEMRLPLVMAILATLNSQSDALIGSVMLPVTVIGYFFFATQLTAQPAMLVANSLRSVLSPATAAIRGDPEGERRSIRDTFNVSMVFVPLVSMALPAVFDSFDRAIWGGKWGEIRLPIFILSIALVYPTVVLLVAAPISSIRDWNSAIRLDTTRAVSKIIGAAIGSVFILWLQTSVITSTLILASAVGAASAVSSVFEIVRVGTRAGMPTTTIFYELYSTPLAALLSALAASGLAHSICDGPISTQIGPKFAVIVELAISSMIYAVLAVVLLRFGYTSALERFIQALPISIQSLANRIMHLR